MAAKLATSRGALYLVAPCDTIAPRLLRYHARAHDCAREFR
jgi:hypothetical protein